MTYKALDGNATVSLSNTIKADYVIVRRKCTVLENGKYRLLKIPDIEHAIPYLYGKYKMSNLSFPLYLVESKQTQELRLIKNNPGVDNIVEFIKRSL